MASRKCPDPCVPPSDSAPPCGLTGIRPLIRILLPSSSQLSSMNGPASPGPHQPAFSIQLSVIGVNPSYGK